MFLPTTWRGEAKHIVGRREYAYKQAVAPAQTTRTAARGNRKAGPLWEGEIQKEPGLTIDRIVVSGRTRAHTPDGVSLYARWPVSRVLERGKVQAPLQEDGGRARQGIQRGRPGRRGKPRPDYGLPNLTSWLLSVVNIRCSAFKTRFDASRCVL